MSFKYGTPLLNKMDEFPEKVTFDPPLPLFLNFLLQIFQKWMNTTLCLLYTADIFGLEMNPLLTMSGNSFILLRGGVPWCKNIICTTLDFLMFQIPACGRRHLLSWGATFSLLVITLCCPFQVFNISCMGAYCGRKFFQRSERWNDVRGRKIGISQDIKL